MLDTARPLEYCPGMPDREQYSLRQLVELTGLSEFTLRGWENRYGAFRPARSETGRREYSPRDLQKAILLRELTSRGKRIGDIAQLPASKLGALLEADDQTAGAETRSPDVAEALRLASLQKWEELEELFRSIGKRKAPLTAALEFVAPLLAGVSALVGLERLTVSQEHMVSSLVKDLLYALRARAPVPKADAKRVLIAAPEGDYHELGILLAHCLVAQHGLRSLYLGPNTPKADICESALHFQASHVLIAATIGRTEGAREALPAVVHFLDTHLAPKVALWIGGREGARLQAQLTRHHSVFATIVDFEKTLRAL